MPVLKPGVAIGIHCEVKQGPFSDERLVSFDTLDGPVTGFVTSDSLAKYNDGQWYIRAIVKDVRGDVVTVLVEGSFFNTNGLANIPREMALAA